MPTSLSSNSHSNLLLDALPKQERERLVARMELVPLKLKGVLWEPGDKIKKVYFPVNGVVSLVASMRDGGEVESATIGREGMVGLPVFFGASSDPNVRAITQVGGEGLRMDASAFRQESAGNGALHRIMERFAQAMFVQMNQSVACNRLHALEERAARWLLMTHDRVSSDEFGLTQEFLSEMLGVRRASVTLAAGMLQKAGYIQYHRGRISVVDRRGLESASCECYSVITAAFDKLQNGQEG